VCGEWTAARNQLSICKGFGSDGARKLRGVERPNALIDYVLAAERQRGQTLTMGDALAELLADITEAARTIGTLLQIATRRP
jgi:hypothetical protein